jgi:hypothetical protein
MATGTTIQIADRLRDRANKSINGRTTMKTTLKEINQPSGRIGLVSALLLIAFAPAGCRNQEDIVTDSEGREKVEVRSGETAHVYIVTSHGIDADHAAKLATALDVGIDSAGAILDEDGAIRYVDVERFQKVPGHKVAGAALGSADEQGQPITSTDWAVDFAGLEALEVPSEESALARFEGALAEAGIDLGPGVTTIGHSVFQSFSKDGTPMLEENLDTQVIHEGRLEGLRLIGPGAKAKVVLDGEGHASQITLAMHELVRGEDVAIIPSSEAPTLCAEQLGEDLDTVTAELVYYAPPLSQHAEKVFPHYVCGGTKLVDGKQVDLRNVVIPATVDAPQVTMKMDTIGDGIHAVAEVQGGTEPYTYSWVSSTQSHAGALDGAEVEYAVVSGKGGELAETLTLRVTDANGLTATVAETSLVSSTMSVAAMGNPQRLPAFGSIGTEWVGECGNLSGSAGNVEGFVSRFLAEGMAAQFNFGELNAWEIDFKDPVYGGQDTTFADAVDLVFYTGHGGPDGFYFCSEEDDQWIDLGTEGMLGNTNLEWLVIAACGPLQGTQWPNAFTGMHLLFGYSTISYDNVTEGMDFASGLLNNNIPLTVRVSWAIAATNSQPADVTFGYAGIWALNDEYWVLANIDDYFWGMGYTGGDYENLYGTWLITSPS